MSALPPDRLRARAVDPVAGADARAVSVLDRYGWRVFAVPVLAVLTIVALFRPGGARPTPEAQVSASARTSAAAGETPAPITVAAQAAIPSHIWSRTETDPCRANRRSSFVVVDIARQRVSMCEGTRQVYGSVATTGATRLGRATPTGTWIVAGKQTNRYLSGSDYDVFVRYWIPFDGDIGFHDASWQKMPFGASGYTSLGSHGCVHLPTPVMQWLYHWIEPGRTAVTVVA